MAAAASEHSTRHCDSYATVEATVTWNQSGKGFNLIGGEEEAAIARRVEPYFRVSHHSPVLGIQLGPFDRLTAAPLGTGFWNLSIVTEMERRPQVLTTLFYSDPPE